MVPIIRLVPPRVAYVFLIPICLWFMLADRRGARASRDYLRRVLGPASAPRETARVFLHFFTFARTLADHIALVSGADTAGWEFRTEGIEHILEPLGRGSGVILLGAHAGAWQAAAHMLRDYDVTVNVVAFEGEAEGVRRAMSRVESARAHRVIAVDEGFTQIVEILAALRRGEIVAMHGDRTMGGRTVSVPFFGKEARFPVGPYHLAALAGVPLVHALAMRTSGPGCRFMAWPGETLQKPSRRDRDAFHRACAARFAARLEEVLRANPYQWFNFYPFWGETLGVEASRGPRS